MTQATSKLIRAAAGFAVSAALAASAVPALAQIAPGTAGPGATPPLAPVPRPHASSSIGATADTPAEERETRVLAGAVFARPAAAARAADKAAEATQPDLAAEVQPKVDWTARKPPLVGGRGLELSTPF